MRWSGNKGRATYNSGTEVTLSATADIGYSFTGWSGGGCSGTGTCTIAMDEDKNIVVEFIKKQGYTIIASVTGKGGNINPEGESNVKAGDSMDFTIIPDAGYMIADVKVSGKSVKSQLVNNIYKLSNVTKNKTITATFKHVLWTITPYLYGVKSKSIIINSCTNIMLSKINYSLSHVVIDGTTTLNVGDVTDKFSLSAGGCSFKMENHVVTEFDCSYWLDAEEPEISIAHKIDLFFGTGLTATAVHADLNPVLTMPLEKVFSHKPLSLSCMPISPIL